MARSEKQKLKILCVAKYFLEYSDENHSVVANDIRDYLLSEYGIEAERRSIYRDIAALRDEFNFDIEGEQGGRYRLASRPLEFDDLRLIAECVYAAKFIPEEKAKALVDSLSSLCSHYQAEDLCGEVFLHDRVKTTKKGILNTVGLIRQAMATKWEGKNHTPQRISFQYMRHTVKDLNKLVPRFYGRRFVVSPYRLLMNDGNYYLLGYDHNLRQIRTYRLDRIHNIRFESAPRGGQLEYEALDMRTYVKQNLFMIPGEVQLVKILFDNKLLDTVMERFGTDPDVFYSPEGSKHFVLTVNVAVTDQFFAWVCGFGTQAKIIGPEDVVKKAKHFLNTILQTY